MKDIRRSKIAKRYQFRKWFQDHEGWIGFMWLVILLGLILATINNTTVCVVVVMSWLFLLMLLLLIPEYTSIEDCEKQLSMRAYRKRERRNRKWLM